MASKRKETEAPRPDKVNPWNHTALFLRPFLFVWEVTETIVFYEVEKYTLLFDQEDQGVITEEYVGWEIESWANTVYNSLMFLQNFQSIVSHGHILSLIYSTWCHTEKFMLSYPNVMKISFSCQIDHLLYLEFYF